MLKVYTIEQNDEWDKVVMSFTDYDTYWLSGYVKAFEIHGDGTPMLLFYEDTTVRGVNVVMKRDISESQQLSGMIPNGKYYDFATPYGYGGWLIEGERTEKLFDEYEKWCKNHNIISEFVRFHPMIKNHIKCLNHYDVVKLGNTVFLDLSSDDVIWSNITSKNRNVIRKAKKNNVKIYNGRFPEIFETFRLIYNETMNKDNASDYYYFKKEFYDSICEDLPNNAQIFYAMYENKVIAASIMLCANGYMNYHLSGSVKEFSRMAASNLMIYNAALWGRANGYRTLYLGGGVGSGEDSLFKFKKSFNRTENYPQFHIGKKIFDYNVYEKLVKMRTINENETFFPLYRA